MSRMDVAIVGAGPAGSWAAYRLARAGARVTLIDGSHPREKPCGGGVTSRALELLGDAIDPACLPAVTVKHAAFCQTWHTAVMPLDSDGSEVPSLIISSRRRFDAALLALAIDAGASLVASRAVSIGRREHGWTIRTRETSVDADWVLGADGVNSLVRRYVGQPFRRADLSIATGYFVRGRSSAQIDIAFEGAPHGYLWSFPRPDHLAVGICAQADSASSAQLQAHARDWISRKIGSGCVLDRYSWPIPSLDEAALGRERPAGDRWMLLGDAAGLVDPITREGIFFALQSGDLAAGALLSSADTSVTYEQEVRDQIHHELTRAARLKARFFRPAFTALMIDALGRSRRVQRVMRDLIAGRQSYRGLRRRLLETFEFRLMAQLFGGAH